MALVPLTDVWSDCRPTTSRFLCFPCCVCRTASRFVKERTCNNTTTVPLARADSLLLPRQRQAGRRSNETGAYRENGERARHRGHSWLLKRVRVRATHQAKRGRSGRGSVDGTLRAAMMIPPGVSRAHAFYQATLKAPDGVCGAVWRGAARSRPAESLQQRGVWNARGRCPRLRQHQCTRPVCRLGGPLGWCWSAAIGTPTQASPRTTVIPPHAGRTEQATGHGAVRIVCPVCPPPLL